MADNNNNGQETQQETEQNMGGQQTQGQQSTNTKQQNTQTVDVEKAKADAVNDLLKSMGYESTDAMKAALDAHKQYEDSKKTDLQRSEDTLKETTRQLTEEHSARIIAEAKVEAMKLGVKPALVDDVVLIAKSRVTKEKDITAVLTEMKNNSDEKMFFESESEEDEKDGKKKSNETRKRINNNAQKEYKKQNDPGDGQNGAGKHAGTMAARLLQNRRPKKSYYFGK